MEKLYGEFKVGDLFEIKGVKQAKSQKYIPSDKDGIPYVVQSQSNNMVSRCVNKQYLLDHNEPVCQCNAIVLGVTLSAVSYQPVEFGASQVIAARADFLNEKVGIYLVTILKKEMYKFSYDIKPGIQLYKDMILRLPLVDGTDDTIDFEYMECCIDKLEQEYIGKLDTFLHDTGLEAYELSEEDVKTLSQNVTFKAYQIRSLFDKLKASYKGTGRRQDNVSKVQTSEFSLPLINCKDGNNGIMYYGREEDFDHYTNVLSVIYNGPPTVGRVYAQEKIGVYTDAYLIALKKEIMPKMSLDLCFYLKTAVEKAIHNTKYSRADKATWYNKVENDYIYLPTTDGINPDYEYMEKYIQVQKKIAIKGTVEFKNMIVSK